MLYLYIFGNQITTIPESICTLDLNWSELDDGFMPYFACGGNNLCEDIPSFVEESRHTKSQCSIQRLRSGIT